MHPSVLAQWPGLRALRACVARPAQATHVVQGPNGPVEDEFDYFIISEDLAPLVREVRVLYDFEVTPHRAVLLRLGGKKSLPLQLSVMRPRSYGRELPPPALPPVQADWAGFHAALGACDHAKRDEGLDALYATFVGMAELELATIYQIGGKSLKPYLGRGASCGSDGCGPWR